VSAPGAWPSAVLIVDDEVDHAFIVRRMLADVAPDLPVEVITHPSGIASRLLEAPEGALVLMDRRLGPTESLDLLPGLREARPDLAVAILSAALVDEDRERALRLGALDAAEKPGTLDGWRTLLTGLLALFESRAGTHAP
jgi:DNA-binding NtrC family response regulator